ncbi:hypothetical protein [Nostoc sp.]
MRSSSQSTTCRAIPVVVCNIKQTLDGHWALGIGHWAIARNQ